MHRNPQKRDYRKLLNAAVPMIEAFCSTNSSEERAGVASKLIDSSETAALARGPVPYAAQLEPIQPQNKPRPFFQAGSFRSVLRASFTRTWSCVPMGITQPPTGVSRLSRPAAKVTTRLPVAGMRYLSVAGGIFVPEKSPVTSYGATAKSPLISVSELNAPV